MAFKAIAVCAVPAAAIEDPDDEASVPADGVPVMLVSLAGGLVGELGVAATVGSLLLVSLLSLQLVMDPTNTTDAADKANDRAIPCVPVRFVGMMILLDSPSGKSR